MPRLPHPEFARQLVLQRLRRRAQGETTVRVLQGELERERFGMALLPAVYSRTVMAWALAEEGLFARGLEVGHQGLQIAERLNHPHSIVFALHGIGTVHLRRGDFPEAIRILERAQAICETADLPAVFLEVALPLGSAYAQGNRASDAVALFERAVSQAMALKHHLGHWLRSGGMAEAYLAAGRAEEALPLAWARHLLGAVAANVGPKVFDRSKRELRAALASAESLGMRPLAARCHLTLGDLYLRTGRRQEAASEFSAAAEICRAADMPYWLARAEQGLKESVP